MGRKKRKGPTEDLGFAEYDCPHCGKQVSVPWTQIFDLQDMTHGYVGFDASGDFIACPNCGERVNEPDLDFVDEGDEFMTEARSLKAPAYLKADMERAFIQAYYAYVCGCDTALVDWGFTREWVAAGIKGTKAWFMDFSSYYEFPEEMKPATVLRRLVSRCEETADTGASVVRNREMAGRDLPVEVTYEIWCFMPMSQRFQRAVEEARAQGAKFTLVLPHEVQERFRQTVLAVPETREAAEQAFVQAAVMFRQAFGLS